MAERVSFTSAGLKINGFLHQAQGAKPGERRPAFMALHGFGSNCTSSNSVLPAEMLSQWGYAVLRFDFRGCGESEGKRANTICLEQVEDTRNALSFLQTRPEIDPTRIALVGSSFGAAVAVYAGGVEERVAAVISSGGWGDGATKFRKQHASPEAWKRFTDMMARGKEERARTGKASIVPRYDIVPIPERLRGHLAQNSIMEFTFETVESMYDFRANDVVGKIAPRPLLLLHASNDSVTPTEQSVVLFQHARQPTDLHLIADVDHFMFSHENPRVVAIIRDWLAKFFPVAPR